jgi:hypothetical protein
MIRCIPVSQLYPVYPGWHVHVYMLTLSLHLPPFLQGELAHSVMSAIQAEHSQLKYIGFWYTRYLLIGSRGTCTHDSCTQKTTSVHFGTFFTVAHLLGCWSPDHKVDGSTRDGAAVVWPLASHLATHCHMMRS